MSKESDYLRAEVSRAQKEGATSVLVRVPEIHAILARIAELERFKAELPTGSPVKAGYVNLEALQSMHAGGDFFMRLARGKRTAFMHPVYHYPPGKEAPEESGQP